MNLYTKKILTLFSVIIVFSLSFADTIPGPPSPVRILVIRSQYPMSAAINEIDNKAWTVCNSLSNGQHDGPDNLVTISEGWPATPPDKANYDQVWDLRFNNEPCKVDPCSDGITSLTSAQQDQLRNFMAQGGSVFLLGENEGFPGRNNGVIQFVNSVIASGTFAASGIGTDNTPGPPVGCCSSLDATGAAGAEDFGNDYNNLMAPTPGCGNGTGRIFTQYPGAVRLTELATGHSVARTDHPADFIAAGVSEIGAVGVAFKQSDLKAPYNNGKLFIWFDYQAFQDPMSYCCPNYINGHLARNIQDFLVIPMDTPTPTPTNTPTNTSTNTPTNTSILTPTNSSTNSPTNTRTNTSTATDTGTSTSTSTLTFTPTSSSTITNTATNTNTFTFTATNTASNTFTNTLTMTLTFTNTVTGTPPPTWTNTNTPTNTDTFTSTFTYTITNTFTVTPTYTETNTRTYTSTLTNTGTPSFTGTATNTKTYTSTSTSSFTFTLTSTFTNTSTVTLTATETPTFQPSPSLLKIKKKATGEEPKPGNKIKYTIFIENNDNGCANNLAVWDTLPDYTKYSKSITGPTPIVTGNYIYWDLSIITTPVCYGGPAILLEFEVELLNIPKDIPLSNKVMCDYNDALYISPQRHPPIISNISYYPADLPVIYPNPFNPKTAVDRKLKIDNLIPGSLIQIYTVSGEIVIALDAQDLTVYWDGKNRYGYNASPGIYYWLIKTPSNNIYKGKLFIINK